MLHPKQPGSNADKGGKTEFRLLVKSVLNISKTKNCEKISSF